ncbi:MAG: helix-turn-helix transcriptional regulator [Flavobacteriales bacterium]|nr:helix-turn-helix transcriptional regulator [Flavobacteriales bacterium]
MPNIQVLLREEITRLARKELKKEVDAIKKINAQQRRDLADLKKRNSGLERKVALLESKVLGKITSRKAKEGLDNAKLRFTAKGLKSQRSRLGLSAHDFGRLIDVSGLTIYNWEKGTTRPRAAQLAKLAAVRQMGKKEAKRRLETIGGQEGNAEVSVPKKRGPKPGKKAAAAPKKTRAPRKPKTPEIAVPEVKAEGASEE